MDPFSLWVNEFFELSDKKDKHGLSDYAQAQEDAKARKANISNSLVPGRSMIEVLDQLYREELDELISNYKRVCSLDDALFKELDISVKSVVSSIKKPDKWSEKCLLAGAIQ